MASRNVTATMWIVQDVFSSGIPGPGYTLHTDRAEAEQEARERDAALVPYSECPTCGSPIGYARYPLAGGCNECR